MKKTITHLMLCLAMLSLNAQNKMFKHTATASNTVADYTVLDHPALNGNPGAKFVISHAFNPINATLPGVYNNRFSGVRYNTTAAKWMIYNEDETNLVAGSSYFVYMPSANNVFQHIATEENSFLVVSRLDNAYMNGNTAAVAVVTNNFLARRNLGNPTLAYLSWVGTSNPGWNVYMTPGALMEPGNSFFVATAGDPGVVAYKHTALAANIANHATVLSHPLLNGNPNARFVFSRNQETASSGSGEVFLKLLSAQYFFGRWMIFTEDQSPMLPNLCFNIMIEEAALGVKDQSVTEMSAWPNPAAAKVTLETRDAIVGITIYNAAGQHMRNAAVSLTEKTIDMAALPSGIYLAKVQTEKGFANIRLARK